MKELEYLIDQAKASGADQVEAVKVKGASLSLSYRQGQIEKVERADGSDVGLRVLVGQKQAMTSTSELSKDSLSKMVEKAMALVHVVPEDPFIGLAVEGQFTKDIPSLQMVSDEEVTKEGLIQRAKMVEEAALAVPEVTQSEGAQASWGSSSLEILSSEGFSGSYLSSQQGLVSIVVAGSGENMQRDYDYTTAIFSEDLVDPAIIGRKAGEKAVQRLNPRKVKTGHYPVIYDRRLGGAYLLNPFVEAINGLNIARGTSFLRGELGKPVFNESVVITDNPLMERGLGSRPFDGEGLPSQSRNIVDKGVLETWLLNLHAARQLKLEPTGHGSRSISTSPGVAASNLYLNAGDKTPQQLMADIQAGFYVTELMGFGINGVTGDYSLGASGFWIENGVIAYPVSEVTVAGNLKDMYRNLVPANDLVFDGPTCTPTVLIEQMMVAGL